MRKLQKLEIAPGITWVEAPDADLRLLCGCPADAVKHLMRRGIIRWTEEGGVRFETGPNTLLLSDVMIQNGAFCNMAEFPILQMFYRQGMLLPGHRNNTGAKPLLIGRRDQLDAQMQYIYRGNYGLVSEEEIIAAGVDAATARDMMRLKLRFAFGRIQDPRELLDGLEVSDEAGEVEIRNGVTLRRTALNVFEIAFEGETVSVDLNLPPWEGHECPYPLGAFQFRREFFSVIHSGEGDGWDIRRPSMGSVLVYQGRIYLIDAGPNLIHTLTALGIGINEVEGIFHTHSHDDHFAGLTTLIQADSRIKYYAAPLVRAAVTKKLAALLSIDEDAFSDYFEVHDLEIGQWSDVGGLEVRPIFSPHPVETTIFMFRALAEGGYRSYAHFADVVGLKMLEGMITDDAARPGISREWFEQIRRDYAEPADIKKVDIGGGLIHGDAHDFRDDASPKIILAHTSQKLTDEQKGIGSGASFGTVDVLVPSLRDFIFRSAYAHLGNYFPTVPGDHIDILLNGRVLTFNPETILLKEGQDHDVIYLLLTGQVETLSRENDIRGAQSAGALLGELTGLHGLPPSETYRAVSFVQVLEMSCRLYVDFVQRHDLFGEISRLMETREFLSKTWLFSRIMSTGTLNAIAKALSTRQVAIGRPVECGEGMIGMVKSGKVVRRHHGKTVEKLFPGDFFGEEAAMFHTCASTTLTATEDSELYTMPADLLRGIPNVHWKLFESFQRRSAGNRR
jgi:hemerythrin